MYDGLVPPADDATDPKPTSTSNNPLADLEPPKTEPEAPEAAESPAPEAVEPEPAAPEATDAPAETPEPEPPVEPAAAPEPAPTAAPAAPAAAPQAQADPYAGQLRELAAQDRQLGDELKALLAKKSAKPDEWDPYGEDAQRITELTAKRQDVQQQRLGIQENLVVERAYWDNWQSQHPTITNGRALYAEEYARAVKKYGDTETARAVATERWQDRIDALKAKPAPAPAKPPTPAVPSRQPTITPKGGSVLPKQNRHTPPAPVKESAAEKVLKEIGPLKDWKF
jgi:hypothetical protein